MPKKFIFILMSTLLAATTHAAQYKDVTNMQTLTVDLSIKDPNIISAKNDRIQQYSAVKGAVTASIDSETGILNLKPTVMYYERPFSMIVFTEHGNRYTLISNPKNLPAQDIVLVNNEILNKENNINSSSYDAEISNLIKAMIKDENLSGYKREQLNKVTTNENTILISSYSGGIMSGQIMLYTNNTDRQLKLAEEEFYAAKVLAISASNNLLNPKEVTKIYRVVKNG